MKVASLFSGGKDSAFALWYAQSQGWSVEALVTVFPEVSDSWMFHSPALKWTDLQAKAAGIPHLHIQTSGVKEHEVDELKAGLQGLKQSAGIEALVSGAIASEYQRTRLDNLCESLGLHSFAPLWHKDQAQLLTEEVEGGLDVIITACGAMGLGKDWLGRSLGQGELKELFQLNRKYGLNVAFEGGEAETFTLASPSFRRRIVVVKSTPHWKADSGYLELNEVRLA